MWNLPRVLLSVIVLTSGCTSTDETEPEWVTPSQEGKGDGWNDLVVSGPGMAVTLERELARTGDQFVLKGSADHKLTAGAAFARSRAHTTAQPIGAWIATGEHEFELRLSSSDLSAISAGAGIYMDLTPEDATAGQYYVLEIEAESRVTGYDGTINPTLQVTPHWIDGRVSYRLAAHHPQRWYGADIVVGDEMLSGTVEDERLARFDIPETTFVRALGTETIFEFMVDGEAGGEGRFSALVARARLGRSNRTASQVHVFESCLKESCLQALPDGTLDTSSCGSAVDVMACHGELGIRVDDALVTAALAANPIDAALLDGLIGPLRSAQLKSQVATARRELLTSRIGAWYLDAESARASMAADLDRLWGRALANPFTYVEPRGLRTNQFNSAGDVAADALLRYLPSEDLVHSEFDTTYVEACRTSAADHVWLMRMMRAEQPSEEGADPYMEISTHEGRTTFQSDWLGAYIAVTVGPDIDPQVYFEID